MNRSFVLLEIHKKGSSVHVSWRDVLTLENFHFLIQQLPKNILLGTKYSYLYQCSPQFKFQNQLRMFRVWYGRFKIMRRMSSQFIQDWPKTLNEYIFGSIIHVRFESFHFLRKYYTCDIPEGMIADWRWFSTHSTIVIQILPKTAQLSDSWLDL